MNVDGNLAALARYEREQDEAMQAQEEFECAISEALEEIERLAKYYDVACTIVTSEANQEAILLALSNDAYFHAEHIRNEGYNHDFKDYADKEINRVKGDLDL